MAVTINKTNTDAIEIIVTTNNSFRIRNNNVIYLFIQTHGVINHISSEKVTTDITRIVIPGKELISGLNHITIFDSGGEPCCEKYNYTPEIGRNELRISSAESYKTREKISLGIDFSNDKSNIGNSSNFSVSVSPVINRPDNILIDEYMLFGSEFGLMPWQFLNGRKIKELTSNELDSLLSGLESNWIKWENILSDYSKHLKYQVEDDSHFLEGKIVTQDQKAPESEEYLFLSSPGKIAEFQYARTDKQGNFSFKIPIDESVKDLIIQPDETTMKNRIDINSSFPVKYYKSDILRDSSNSSIPAYVSKWGINYQVGKIYESSYTGEMVSPILTQHIPKRFYGKPNQELKMEDYILLPVMEEVFFELLPGVALKRKKDIYEISMADPITNNLYGVPPGVLVDGVIVKDPTVIGNLDPEQIEQIDVVREKYFVGSYMFYGIVNLISKTGDYSIVTLPDYAIRMPYRVLDPMPSFVSPAHSEENSDNNHIPDFRNTLYWNPSITTNENGKTLLEFWSSDVVSEYEILIQGIGQDGKFISSSKTFIVE